jgi:SAM-dependent methyltransferase
MDRFLHESTPGSTVAAYNALAHIYDHVMRHVDYGDWFSLIQRIHMARFRHMPSICEVGAGTGTLGHMLSQAGYHYIASDASPAMCRAARAKGAPVMLCCDATGMALNASFDMVLFLYDGINYLTDLDAYARFFAESYRCLRPGGILLFDITTDYNSRRYFQDVLDHEETGTFEYIRKSRYDKKKHIQYNDFSIFIRNGPHAPHYTKYQERHVQYVFPVRDITRTIDTDRFSIIGIWDGFSFDRWKKTSERIHFCLKKNAR